MDAHKSVRRRLKSCYGGAIFSGKCFPCFSSGKSSFSDASSESSPDKLDSTSELPLLCSYGGRLTGEDSFSPTYRGGDNRIIGVDRNCSAAELFHRLSTTLLGGRSFTLKYNLSGPGPAGNALVTVVTDEDLKYMIEEYDRFPSFPMHKPPLPRLGFPVGQPKKSHQSPQQRRYLRVFLVPKDPENASQSAPICPASDFDDFSDDEPS